ncbi:MAG: 3-oxoacyl-ACP synthase [Legionellales bacterium]|nr:3-oxoacyl-ACP synthase [Legionellales bacterium]
MQNEVVITGYGAIGATGHDVETMWNAIIAGESGIAEITQWELGDTPYRLAGEIKNAKPQQLIADRKLLKLISKQDVLGIYAANQAIEHSGLIDYRNSLTDATDFNDRSGIYVGSPGNKFYQQYDFMPLLAHAKNNLQEFGKKLFEEIHPMWLLKILPNNVLAYVGMQHQFKGPNQNITNHAVSGSQALAEAMHAIQQGQIDRALVVAYDCAAEPQGNLYYGSMGILSAEGIYSFDERHNGTVLAEAGAAILLESKISAQQRHAKIYGSVLAAATATEASGVFAIGDNGDAVKRSLEVALKHAKLTSHDIGMITAHANGTPQSDNSEAKAIHAVFDNKPTPVTGFKWSCGHTLASAGILDTIFSIKALQESCVPAIATLTRVAKECANLNLSTQHQPVHANTAMIIARGFGGIASSLIITAS